VGKDPSKNMKAFEDFLLVVLSLYLITAAEDMALENQNCVEVSKEIVSRWVKINILPPQQADNTAQSTAPVNTTMLEATVNEYTAELITLGLLWHGFHDAIREGDDDRISMYWKFLLPVFKEENHHNYAKEAFILILQSKILSPRKLCELKWNRTVNTHGKPGHNVPCDLHMEHLN